MGVQNSHRVKKKKKSVNYKKAQEYLGILLCPLKAHSIPRNRIRLFFIELVQKFTSLLITMLCPNCIIGVILSQKNISWRKALRETKHTKAEFGPNCATAKILHTAKNMPCYTSDNSVKWILIMINDGKLAASLLEKFQTLPSSYRNVIFGRERYIVSVLWENA